MIFEALATTLREVGIALGIFFGVPTLAVIAFAVVRWTQTTDEEIGYRREPVEPVDFDAALRGEDIKAARVQVPGAAGHEQVGVRRVV
jgi:hypothetical protein